MNELNLIRDADPAAKATGSIATRADLLEQVRMVEPEPRRRSRFGRKGVVALVAGVAVVATGGGIAYAVLGGQPATTALKVNCAAGVAKSDFDRSPDFTSVMDSVTGDAVADCRAAYVRLDGSSPTLRAYSNGSSSIEVIPVGWTAPAAWQPLSSGFRADGGRLELDQRLSDLVAGPPSRCMSTADATALARQDLSDLGLTGWSVGPVPGAHPADGTSYCAIAWVDEDGSDSVELQGVSNGVATPAAHGAATLAGHAAAIVAGPGADKPRTYATYLGDDIAARCLALPAARRTAVADAARAGLPSNAVHVTTITDASASCTRVVEVPGGFLDVVLRGPAH